MPAHASPDTIQRVTTRTREPDTGELLAAIEPFAWAEDPLYVQFGKCDVHAIIKPKLDPDWTPHQLRVYLLERADEMVAAMQATGWYLLGKYRIEFSALSRGPGVTLAGEVLKPPEQGCISCDVSLTVWHPKPA